MTAAEALARYRAHAGDKPAAIVERYLRWGGQPSEGKLLAYLRRLESEHHLAPGTVDLHRRTIQAFYRFHQVLAPRLRGWRYDPKDAQRPALATDLVAQLITAARAGELSSRQTSLLALATTYGMRAGELAAVQAQDVDLPGERIYIRTLKGGASRWCWLPPVVAGYLQDVWPRCSPNSVEKTFDNMWAEVSDKEKPRRTNWHAVRRALVRDLLAAGAPAGDVSRFLRWARGGAAAEERMVHLYGNPSEEVAATGVTAARTEDTGRRDYDAAAWDRHPYLKLWEV